MINELQKEITIDERKKFTRLNILIAIGWIAILMVPVDLSAQQVEQLAPNRVEQGAPSWLQSYHFRSSFTFVRLRYDQPQGRWATDYPDADIHLSNRLEQLTTLDVDPNGLVLDAEDPRLANYPFAYLSANGPWNLSDSQVDAVHKYLEGGGFLMIDDSWGKDELDHTLSQLRRIFPNRSPTELPMEHKIFHCVFDLTEKPQVCSIHAAIQGRDAGITWERPGTQGASYLGIADDDGRLMVLICHNTDLADGWERYADHPWYAAEFSERRAFPMGINVVFYVLTSSK